MNSMNSMVCDINIWDDFLEEDDTFLKVESTDFSHEVEGEILQYIKNVIADHKIIEPVNMIIDTYGEYEIQIDLLNVTYNQVNDILELFKDPSVNVYLGIHLNVYSES